MSDEPHVRPTPPRKQSKWKKIAAYLKLASDVGGIVMTLRDKPSGMDVASLALRTANIGVGWYTDRHKAAKAPNTWDYFDTPSGWTGFPNEYRKIVLAGAQELQVAEEYMECDVKLPYACLAKIGDQEVGWTVENGQVTEGPFYKEAKQAETWTALGKLLWKILGGKHLLYAPGGIVLDVYKDDNAIPTKQMQSLLDRTMLFLRADVPRGYLLAGVPGTGKSVAIRWLTRALNLTSVRVDLRLLSADAESRGHGVAASLETMLRILRPDVMILDDLDRIDVTAQVLQFLETARQSCRIVMASANSVTALQGAALRPGRIDDIITFDKLDPAVIARMLGVNADLTDLVDELPAAYVAEFARRCLVLGREQALEDLPELEERAEATSEDAD